MDDRELIRLAIALRASADRLVRLEELHAEVERLQIDNTRLEAAIDADTATRHGRILANAVHGRIGRLQDEEPDSPIVRAYWFFMAPTVRQEGEGTNG